VDDGGADLDPLRPGTDRCQQRERRSQLLGEVMDPEVGAVGAQLLDRLGELDGLHERVRPGAHLRVRRARPVTEREEADLLHGSILEAMAGPARSAARRLRPNAHSEPAAASPSTTLPNIAAVSPTVTDSTPMSGG